MAEHENEFDIDDFDGLNDDIDQSFNDILISADDSLESILEKYANAKIARNEAVMAEESATEELKEPELTIEPEIETFEEESPEVFVVKEEKKPVPKKKQSQTLKKINSFIYKTGRSLRYSFEDFWKLIRYEFIADPESFFRKLGFTVIEATNKFMYWFAKVSRYFMLPLSIGIVVAAVFYFATHTLAIRVTMNNEFVGYINDTSEYDTAVLKAQENLTQTLGEECQIDIMPEYELALVRKDLVLTSDNLENSVTEISSKTVGKNYGLFIDGNLIGTHSKQSALEEMLDNIKMPYETGAQNETVVFVQNVEIIEGDYEDNLSLTIAEMRSKLMSSSVIDQHTWKENDKFNKILKKYNMTEELFYQLNPNEDEVFAEGDIINVVVVKPLISVQVQRTVVFDEKIPYETEISYDPNTWENRTTVVTEGVDGVREVTANILLIDGVEKGREIISEVIVREPISEIIIEGTKEISSSGEFIWPLEIGDFFQITDRYYEPRDGSYHGALDIAGWEGTPILACDAGEVIEAGWNGSYGYNVLVLHDSGVKTRYAHLSAISVDLGDIVYQGQELGLMGNTGYSTGTHLHLEVIIDGERSDPELYVDIPGE